MAGDLPSAIRRNQGLVGKPVEVHEVQPVKFGGSPTDPANKVMLARDVHRATSHTMVEQASERPWFLDLERQMQFTMTEGELNAPASVETITALESGLGMRLPRDYGDFLARHDGGEGFIGDAYLVLWRAGEIERFNREYELHGYAPGILLFGSDGGGEGFGYDLQAEDMAVIRMPFIGMSRRTAVPIAGSFTAFYAGFAGAAEA